tara:strand:+ start:2792 stop:3028 length:237 start_codon:yes stop_codon:yes gene_type:complete
LDEYRRWTLALPKARALMNQSSLGSEFGYIRTGITYGTNRVDTNVVYRLFACWWVKMKQVIKRCNAVGVCDGNLETFG